MSAIETPRLKEQQPSVACSPRDRWQENQRKRNTGGSQHSATRASIRNVHVVIPLFKARPTDKPKVNEVWKYTLLQDGKKGRVRIC